MSPASTLSIPTPTHQIFRLHTGSCTGLRVQVPCTYVLTGSLSGLGRLGLALCLLWCSRCERHECMIQSLQSWTHPRSSRVYSRPSNHDGKCSASACTRHPSILAAWWGRFTFHSARSCASAYSLRGSPHTAHTEGTTTPVVVVSMLLAWRGWGDRVGTRYQSHALSFLRAVDWLCVWERTLG